jgi:integrase
MRGHVRLRGNVWYAVLSVGKGHERKTVWRSLPECKGKREAETECRRLVREIDTGDFVMTYNSTVSQWIEHWLSIGCPGRKRRAVGNKTSERYGELLRTYILPTLGNRPLQKLQSTEIDALYTRLVVKISQRTLLNTHTVFASSLAMAFRQRKVGRNPLLDVLKVPSPGEADHGIALDADELRTLVQGFKERNSILFPIVATLAWTGMRRGECLALHWSDFDAKAKTLRIERSVEETEAGLAIKGPKKDSHKRTIAISDDLLALLTKQRAQHLRVVAGAPLGADVDFSLVRLPEGALIFPAMSNGDLTNLRSPRAVSTLFKHIAKRIGFPKVRLHDLRGSHETALLDAGVPVHTVAARCGHDPATLLRSYAKRTRKADESAAAVIGSLSAGVLS